MKINEAKRREIAAWNLQVDARKAAKRNSKNGRPVKPHRSGGGYPVGRSAKGNLA